jgi:uncharacterized protein (TIGR03435 family)
MKRFVFAGAFHAAGIAWFSSIFALNAAAAPLTFEVASVKPSTSGNNGFSGGCHGIDSHYGRTQLDAAPPLGRCVIHDARLSHLIAMAFSLGSMELLKSEKGPDWVALGAERFNIEAKAEDPTKATEAQLLQMLQTLLIERFNLKFHREEKDMQGFALVVAKSGPKLEKAKDDEVEPRLSGTTKVREGEPITLNGRKCSMQMLANLLSQRGEGPVVDKTGLQGTYNFKLWWDDRAAPSLFTALTEQLGLRLEAQKVPVSFFVIESAQRPTPN